MTPPDDDLGPLRCAGLDHRAGQRLSSGVQGFSLGPPSKAEALDSVREVATTMIKGRK